MLACFRIRVVPVSVLHISRGRALPEPQRTKQRTPRSGRAGHEAFVVRLCQSHAMLTAVELQALLRAAWGPDTCYPAASEEWRPDNPARDQCGMTALVVHDLLGGDLIVGEVHVDGIKVGNHYWNRLPDGTEIDLTAEQFLPEECIVNGQVVVRPPDAPRRHRQQYELLSDRVLRRLADATAHSDGSHATAPAGGNALGD